MKKMPMQRKILVQAIMICKIRTTLTCTHQRSFRWAQAREALWLPKASHLVQGTIKLLSLTSSNPLDSDLAQALGLTCRRKALETYLAQVLTKQSRSQAKRGQPTPYTPRLSINLSRLPEDLLQVQEPMSRIPRIRKDLPLMAWDRRRDNLERLRL